MASCCSSRSLGARTLQSMSNAELDERFNATNYHSVAAQMGTGDVLLFHGTAAFSNAIKVATRSWYSHASVLLRRPSEELLQAHHVPNRDANELYVLDCEVETNDKRAGGGVQLVSLEDWVAQTKQEQDAKGKPFFLAWRQLQLPNHPPPLTCADFPGLEPMVMKTITTAYEKKKGSLLLAILHLNHREDLSSVFCSEMVAWAYKAMGLLPQEHNASNATPIQFSHLYRNDRINGLLLQGAALAPDRRIHMNPASANGSHPPVDGPS